MLLVKLIDVDEFGKETEIESVLVREDCIGEIMNIIDENNFDPDEENEED